MPDRCCIAMASIIAKVTRDRLMDDLDEQFPGYGFATAQGLPAPRNTARRSCGLGKTAQHREMFLRKLLAGRIDPTQMDFLGE